MSPLLSWLSSPRALRASSLFLLFLALAMQIISAFYIGAFWLDEADSVNMALLPLPQLWDYLKYDSYPIGHFLLYKAWLGVFGWMGIQNAIRLLSFLAGIAAVGTFWLLSRRVGGTYPLFGFALFCLNPMIARFIGTTRPYGLSTLTLLATAYFGFQFLQNGARRSLWCAGFCAFAAAQTHYLNVLGLGVIALAAGATDTPRVVRAKLALALALAVASLSIYLPTLSFASREWAFMFRGNDIDLIAPWRMIAVLAFGFDARLLWVWLCGTVASLFLIFRLARGAWQFPQIPQVRRALPFAAVLIICAPTAWAAMFGWGRIHVSPWYFIPPLALMWVGVEIGLGLGLSASRPVFPPRLRPFLPPIAVTLGLAQFALSPEVLTVPMSRTDVAAALVEKEARQGDMVIIIPWHCSVSFVFYYRGQVPLTRVPPIPVPQFLRWDLARRLAETRDPIPALLDQMKATLQRGDRIFLVGEMVFQDKHHFIAPLPPHRIDTREWTLRRYQENWESRTYQFLEHHPRRTRYLATGGGTGVGFEQFPVNVFSGWEEWTPSSTPAPNAR